jgi:hypothetical protein
VEPKEAVTGMPALKTVQADDQSKVQVQGTHPHETFVVLTDAHGGIHLIPAEYYGEIQERTRAINDAIEARRDELSAVVAALPAQHDEGELAELNAEIRGFARLRRRANRRLLG